MKKAFKLLRRITSVFILWFIVHSSFIIFDGLKDKNQNADVAVVLGNKINPDGTVSKRLKARLNKSVELYSAKRIDKIIVSGGFGKEGFWEGDKMKEYLESKNIPSDKIIVDNYGNDTEKTVENSIRIMDSLNMKNAISVSQYFHQTRQSSCLENIILRTLKVQAHIISNRATSILLSESFSLFTQNCFNK